MGIQKDSDSVIWIRRITISMVIMAWECLKSDVAYKEPRDDLDDPTIRLGEHKKIHYPGLQNCCEFV